MPNRDPLPFLTSDVNAESLLIIGQFAEECVEDLFANYKHVVMADWDKARLDEFGKLADLPNLSKLLITSGLKSLPSEQFDTIIAIWAQHYLGNIQDWLPAIVSRLNLRGRLIIIERIDRPCEAGQQLTLKICDLQREIDLVNGKILHPGYDEERLIQYFRKGHLHYARHKVFTDPDSLYPGEFWLRTLNRLSSTLDSATRHINESKTQDWKNRISTIAEQAVKVTLQSPPYIMLSGIKRSGFQRITNSEERAEHPGHLIEIDKRTEQFEHDQDNLRSNSSPKISKDLSETETRTDLLDNRLMNQMLLQGTNSMTNDDLLTILLDTSHHNDLSTGKVLVDRIIKDFGVRFIAFEKHPGKLAKILDIPVETACRIVSIFELGRRLYEEPPKQSKVVRKLEDAYEIVRDMGNLKKEHLRGLYLDIKNRVIHDEIISIGTLGQSLVHPRDVFAPAIEYSANALILAHNHPSGDVTPSENDVVVTKKLVQAGSLLGIEVIDHLIVGADNYLSLKVARLI